MSELKKFLLNYKELSRKTKIMIISIFLLFVSLIIGLTYAYFSAGNVSGNSNENNIEIVTASHGDIIVNYPDNNVINAEDVTLLPGQIDPGFILKFDLNNTGTIYQKAYIYWNYVTNNFCQYANIETQACTNNEFDVYVGDDLYYELYNCGLKQYENVTSINVSDTCDLIKSRTPAPLTGDLETVTEESTINLMPGLSYYVLKLSIKNTANEQNYQQNKDFSGRIHVDTIDEALLAFEGRVTNTNGEAIQNAYIELMPESNDIAFYSDTKRNNPNVANSLAMLSVNDSSLLSSDNNKKIVVASSNGNFAINDVDPGDYSLNVYNDEEDLIASKDITIVRGNDVKVDNGRVRIVNRATFLSFIITEDNLIINSPSWYSSCKNYYVAKTLTINPNGGTWNNSTTIMSYSMNEFETMQIPDPAPRTGYTFNGWQKTGNPKSFSGTTFVMGTENVVFKATWTAAQYTFKYNCNTGSGSTVSSVHTYGTNSSLSKNGCYKIEAGDANSSKMVYYLKGWSTSPTATSINYAPNAVVKTEYSESKTVTLYAVWGNLFKYSGSHSLINDSNGNWRLKLLTSGDLYLYDSLSLDVFLVGGGGSGSGAPGNFSTGGGGGGGYTLTRTFNNSVNVKYSIVVGAGGARVTGYNSVGNNGGASSAFGFTAGGGYGSKNRNGGNGGSGGAAGLDGAATAGASDGASAANRYEIFGGVGQKESSNNANNNTREFGETSGTLYSGGGGSGGRNAEGGAGGAGGGGKGARIYGDGYAATAGTTNTGGGGGGGAMHGGSSESSYAGAGGSGIVIIRNHRT